MGCECIPPPPVFDLPPPPDPSLIWHLISDEPEDALRKVRLQSCEFSPFFEFIGFDANAQTLILFGIGCFLIVLLTVCSITLCWQKLCSRNRPKRASSATSSKFNSSSDTIVTAPSTHWSTIRSPKFVAVGMPMSGSASATNIANSVIRTQPKMGLIGHPGCATLRMPCQRTVPQQIHQPRTTAIRLPSDFQGSAYCTLNRHYEEIPVNYALPPSGMPTSISYNPILLRGSPSSNHFDDSTMTRNFLDRIAQNAERKPPPNCRPPPPPRSTVSTDELDNSSVDAEIEVINQKHLSLSPPNSRQSEFGGRESGYGTGPSRLWNVQSPKAPPRSSSKGPSHSGSSVENSPPALTVFNQKENPMTYV